MPILINHDKSFKELPRLNELETLKIHPKFRKAVRDSVDSQSRHWSGHEGTCTTAVTRVSVMPFTGES